MDKQLNNIRNFLKDMHRQFPTMRFRCGMGATDGMFIVEVIPSKEYNNESYSRMEVDFCEQFEKEFPCNLLLFVPEGDMCSPDKIFFSVGDEDTPCYAPNRLTFEYGIDPWFMDENDYSLAA